MPDLFIAAPLTAQNSFTPEIEGPACDRSGNIYAVSFGSKPTIGRVTPDGQGEVFVEMPQGSLANGIRFDRAGIMFVADYTGHKVLRIELETRKITVHADEPRMNQPNDLAISDDGTLWASDPDWKNSTGQLWRIDRNGDITRLATNMGTTNGIEVSPDGQTLYVNETIQRNVWAFRIHSDRTISDKKLMHQFPDYGMDGMRADVDGNLYVTRHGKGTVAMLSPAGKLLREIDVLGSKPTNLTFGGPDGRTCYVTDADKCRIVQFRTQRPGLEWKRWRRN